ncbi:SGNH/GDSL hydrolase family protein [Microbacterium pseudoresistens]|uniref:Lysophospholipase L1-like esterase n=1 Tax=Microbacterium pseudoresistens TaxID=640634 RepID=A0A7Y9EWW1_9MICO|nr:SGNH/GDSL hydrolase family protein [Microbacterium pseudoresistens]NYD55440.1 lysophospholipase L1-like esterase [Microbacterium pseudoresistens]
MTSVRYVAIGDSFSEGVGDELPDGRVRGWADLAAQGWADALGEPISYANLGIRGKLAWPVVQTQLEPALALGPTHLSFNAGGNDMLRPKADIEHIADAFTRVLRRCDEEGVRLIVLSGANPSAQLPLGELIQRRGDELSRAVVGRIADRPDVIRALNWPDRELSHPRYWAEDRLHMNALGHHRVAARVLDALGLEAPVEWWRPRHDLEQDQLNAWQYYRTHLAPWINRRLTRRSSGDGRPAKYATWTEVAPQSPVSG